MRKIGVTFGNMTLPYGVGLAPMAGVTDRSFRRVCRLCGADYTVSEMVSAKALCYEQKAKSAARMRSVSGSLASVFPDEQPMAVQLFGSEPDFLAEAARMLESNDYAGCVSPVPPAVIDINMGCPMRKITGNGEGSALLQKPDLIGRIVRAVSDAVSIPVTVKIRSGWDRDSINAPEVARIIEQAGAAMICVHARTREQMYEPGADWSVIADVKQAVSIPVMGNGDIFSADDAIRMLDDTGCDGVMVGRGAMGNPWLFTEICARLDGRAFVPPTLEERMKTAMEQVRSMLSEKGERVGLAEAKKHVAWYCHGINGAAAARARIMTATRYEEMEEIVYSLIAAEKWSI